MVSFCFLRIQGLSLLLFENAFFKALDRLADREARVAICHFFLGPEWSFTPNLTVGIAMELGI